MWETPSIFANPAKPVMPLHAAPLENLIRTGPDVPSITTGMRTATEMARLEREVHTLRGQLLDRIRECPYTDCDRRFSVMDTYGFENHLKLEHKLLQCALCLAFGQGSGSDFDIDRSMMYMNRDQILVHIAEEHSDQLKFFFQGSEKEPEKAGVSQARKKATPEQKKKVDLTLFPYCHKCGRHEARLDDPEDMLHHHLNCRSQDGDGKLSAPFCKTCGSEATRGTSGGMQCSNESCASHNPEQQSEESFCHKCGFDLSGCSNAYRVKHNRLCQDIVPGPRRSYCPFCGIYIADIDAEEQEQHIWACPERPQPKPVSCPICPEQPRGELLYTPQEVQRHLETVHGSFSDCPWCEKQLVGEPWNKDWSDGAKQYHFAHHMGQLSPGVQASQNGKDQEEAGQPQGEDAAGNVPGTRCPFYRDCGADTSGMSTDQWNRHMRESHASQRFFPNGQPNPNAGAPPAGYETGNDKDPRAHKPVPGSTEVPEQNGEHQPYRPPYVSDADSQNSSVSATPVPAPASPHVPAGHAPHTAAPGAGPPRREVRDFRDGGRFDGGALFRGSRIGDEKDKKDKKHRRPDDAGTTHPVATRPHSKAPPPATEPKGKKRKNPPTPVFGKDAWGSSRLGEETDASTGGDPKRYKASPAEDATRHHHHHHTNPNPGKTPAPTGSPVPPAIDGPNASRGHGQPEPEVPEEEVLDYDGVEYEESEDEEPEHGEPEPEVPEEEVLDYDEVEYEESEDEEPEDDGDAMETDEDANIGSGPEATEDFTFTDNPMPLTQVPVHQRPPHNYVMSKKPIPFHIGPTGQPPAGSPKKHRTPAPSPTPEEDPMDTTESPDAGQKVVNDRHPRSHSRQNSAQHGPTGHPPAGSPKKHRTPAPSPAPEGNGIVIHRGPHNGHKNPETEPPTGTVAPRPKGKRRRWKPQEVDKVITGADGVLTVITMKPPESETDTSPSDPEVDPEESQPPPVNPPPPVKPPPEDNVMDTDEGQNPPPDDPSRGYVPSINPRPDGVPRFPHQVRNQGHKQPPADDSLLEVGEEQGKAGG
ncbi:hypothetical protein PG999_001327 [Apiospora kogelbergensis]|uniref:C2H2-type domain-containing protein n=1 Tax=Apiospora kogelbergensis TaxID=1337665 RepID=A0AAW0REA8_9PEZI